MPLRWKAVAPFGQRPPPKDEGEVRWLISYSDFMMQLVCLFILLYSASSLDVTKANEVVRYYREHIGLDEPMRTAEPGLEGNRAAVDERSLVGGRRPGGADVPPGVRFRLHPVEEGWRAEFPGPLFPAGSMELSAEGKAALDELAARLKEYVGDVEVKATAEAPGPDALRKAQERAERAAAHLAGTIEPRSLRASARGPAEGSDPRKVTILFRRR